MPQHPLLMNPVPVSTAHAARWPSWSEWEMLG